MAIWVALTQLAATLSGVSSNLTTARVLRQDQRRVHPRRNRLAPMTVKRLDRLRSVGNEAIDCWTARVSENI